MWAFLLLLPAKGKEQKRSGIFSWAADAGKGSCRIKEKGGLPGAGNNLAAAPEAPASLFLAGRKTERRKISFSFKNSRP